ncbi:MAG: endonuclease [Xanthomonadales bacterium]|jgi:endonuclease I|nr:endonuclease [Xanthomonadales bacterium]
MSRFPLLLAFGLCTLSAQAQVPLTGTPVVQDFDSLAASGTGSTVPAGWAFRETGGTGGSVYTATDGSANSGDTYSAGANGSNERAFGALASNTVTRIELGGRYVNQTGSTLSALTVQYRGELWRLGAASRNDRLDFQYSLDATALDNGIWVDVDALDLLTPNPAATVGVALNGNDPANQSALTHTISGLSIAVGQTIFLRWVDGNITGADDLLAIDDVVVSTGGGGVDLPPSVSSTTPANNATGVATGIVLAVQFSEAVTTAADWLGLSCSQSGTVTGTTSGSGTSRNYTPSAPLAPGETCTATVRAASVTDLDGTPDPMAADVVFGFTIAPDLAPTVSSTTPANGATGVALATNLVVRFSEPVTLAADWYALGCGAAPLAATVSGGPRDWTIDPTQDFPADTNCTLLVRGAAVIDQDGSPDPMAADVTVGFGTAPSLGNYYASIDASSPQRLRETLHALIDDHRVYPYSASTSCSLSNPEATCDTWDILELADEDPLNSARVLDVYRNRSYLKISDRAGTGSGITYNREHTWPNSLGFGSQTGDLGLPNAPYTDAHMLYLSDTQYNADRGNKPYANCPQSGGCGERVTEAYNGQGGGSGIYPGNSNWVQAPDGNQGSFETWGFRKGDIARAVLYMDVRYEGGTHGVTGQGEPQLALTNTRSLIVTGSSQAIAYMGLLDDLIAWHLADPPDAREISRNDVVYGFQGNRNPFIDHPQWVLCLYRNTCDAPADPLFRNGFEAPTP